MALMNVIQKRASVVGRSFFLSCNNLKVHLTHSALSAELITVP